MITTCFSCSYIIQKQKDPTKAHQVKLEVIVKALKWLEMDMDVDEVLISPFTLIFGFRQLPDSLSSWLFFLVGNLIRYLLEFVGGMYNGHTNIQESCERVLCSQEQSGGFKQARSFP
jgi:hypothetical protein